MAFEQDWIAVLTYEGDKISAISELYDNSGTMIQLGLTKGSAEVSTATVTGAGCSRARLRT